MRSLIRSFIADEDDNNDNVDVDDKSIGDGYVVSTWALNCNSHKNK